jgi:hypothetical protein
MITIANTEHPNRRSRSIGALVLMMAISACTSPFGSDSKPHRKFPLDSGARSAPGLVCGVLDRNQVTSLTGVPAKTQHEEALLNKYPTTGEDFHGIDCTVLDESYPQRELLGVSVDQDSFEQDIRRLQQVIDPAPGAVTAPPALGKGAAAPGIGGYVVRRCPNGTNYILRTSTQEKFGTAQQWLALIEGGIRRADAAGACQRKPTLLPAPTSGRPSSG